MDKKYFRKEGHSFVCNNECELIIHKTNIEMNNDGNLDTFLFGSLMIIHDGKQLVTKTVTLGTRVIIPIYTSEQITKNEDDLHVTINFQPGDTFIQHDEVPATIGNVYRLFNNFLLGRLSSTVPREKYYAIMQNAMKTNVQLGFPKVLLEVMIGNLFVDEKGELSRLSGSKVGIPLSINDSVQTANTFNSMTFKDPTKSMVINLGKSQREQTKSPSPLEKYMRM